jgi:hypothetical protein
MSGNSRGVGLSFILVLGAGWGIASSGCGGAPNARPDAAGAAGSSGGAGTTGGSNGVAGTSGGEAGTTMVLDASADEPSPSPADAGCGSMRLDRVAPDLLLLLDRSGSMMEQADGMLCPGGPDAASCVTKWDDFTKAVNQVVMETETSVRWGLKYFANNLQCAVTPGVAVDVGPMNASAIAASIAATTPAGRTPTRLALESAGEYLRGLTDPNPKSVLLATDGLPNCMPGNDTTVLDSMGAIAAVKALADSGVPVYVIGIGNIPDATQTLDAMAMAGGRPRAGSPAYYAAGNRTDLVDALRAIGTQSTPCTYALPSVPARPGDVAIKAANVTIPRDPTHAQGWDYDAGMKTIKLYGTWCAMDQMATLTNVEESGICPATN